MDAIFIKKRVEIKVVNKIIKVTLNVDKRSSAAESWCNV